jgi:hypothetical protein
MILAWLDAEQACGIVHRRARARQAMVGICVDAKDDGEKRVGCVHESALAAAQEQNKSEHLLTIKRIVAEKNSKSMRNGLPGLPSPTVR